MRKHIFLIGYMGCGKSSIGKRLSYQVKQPFLDLDTMIEEKEGKKISEIFAEKGEAYFRDLETETLKTLFDSKLSYVVATGGGLVMREKNRRILKKLGLCIYLRAKPETLTGRLQNDRTRPLLAGEESLSDKIERMLKERGPVYEEAADRIVDVDGLSHEEVTKQAAEAFEAERTLRREKTAARLKAQTQRQMQPEQQSPAAEQPETQAQPEKQIQPGQQVQSELQIQTEQQTPHRVLVMHGPNLNFLGIREPEIYGKQTYQDLTDYVTEAAGELGLSVDFFQSNHEGALIDRIQEAYEDGTEAILINPGALTHYSYALHDALLSVESRIVRFEIHLSDITKREGFRSVSVTKGACQGQIYGKGFAGYREALEKIKELLSE